MTFDAAPLDRPTRTLTLTVVVLLAFGLPLLAVLDTEGAEQAISLAVLTAAAASILVAAYGFAPGGYELAGDRVVVRRRLFGGRAFRLTGRAVRAPWTVGVGSIRRLGSGGLFGWYGSFWRPRVGTFRAYVTDRSRLVALDTDHGPVLLSPADPDAFLAATAATEVGRRR